MVFWRDPPERMRVVMRAEVSVGSIVAGVATRRSRQYWRETVSLGATVFFTDNVHTLCLCKSLQALPSFHPRCGTKVKIPVNRGMHTSQVYT